MAGAEEQLEIVECVLCHAGFYLPRLPAPAGGHPQGGPLDVGLNSPLAITDSNLAGRLRIYNYSGAIV